MYVRDIFLHLSVDCGIIDHSPLPVQIINYSAVSMSTSVSAIRMSWLLGTAGCACEAVALGVACALRDDNYLPWRQPISRLGWGVNKCSVVIFRAGCVSSVALYTAFVLSMIQHLPVLGTVAFAVAGVGALSVAAFCDPSSTTFALHVAGGTLYFFGSAIGMAAYTWVFGDAVLWAWMVTGAAVFACLTATGAPMVAGGTVEWLRAADAKTRVLRFDIAVDGSPTFSAAQWTAVITIWCWFASLTLACERVYAQKNDTSR